MHSLLKKLGSLNQQGVVHLIPLFLLLTGIIAGVYLVQKEGFQLFKPKASSQNVQFLPNECLTTKDSKQVLTCNKVKLHIISPLETGQTTDAGFQLVKTAYADSDDGYNLVGDQCSKDSSRASKLYDKDFKEISTCRSGLTCQTVDFKGLIFGFGKDTKAFCSISGSPVIEDSSWKCEGNGREIYQEGAIMGFFNVKKIPCPSGTTCVQDGNTVYCGVKSDAEVPADTAAPGGGGVGDKEEKLERYACGEDNRVHAVYNTGRWEFVEGYDCNQFNSKCTQLWSSRSNLWSALCRTGAACVVKEKTCTNSPTKQWCIDSCFDSGKEGCYKSKQEAETFGDYNTNAIAPNSTCDQVAGAPGAPAAPAAPAAGTPQTGPGSFLTGCPAGSDKKATYSQCGGTIGLEDKEPSHVYEVTEVRDCNGKLKPYPPAVDKGVSTQCQQAAAAQGGTPAAPPAPAAGGGAAPAPASQTVTTCKNETKTWEQIDTELRGAQYDGAFDHSSAELAAYNRAACPSAANVSKVTTAYRIAESPAELLSKPWITYTNGVGGMEVPYEFSNSIPGRHDLFVQFKDNQEPNQIIKVGLLDYAQISIEFYKEPTTPAPGDTPAAAQPPAGSACSSYETTSVCGGGFKTYDKCTDDKGQTGSQLCSGQATKFYCEGSGNSNCISDPARQGNYSCSACPQLAGRAAAAPVAPSPLGISNCYVIPATVSVGGSVTYQVLVQGGKPPYTYNLVGDVNKSVTSQRDIAEITHTFDSAGSKRVRLVVGSNSERSETICPAVSVSDFDRSTGSIPSSNIPAGSACSAYETASVCGGGFKTYDKCTDDKGQSGSSLCSGGASKFYCVGSTNSNCDSSGGSGIGNYSCSGCPNLR